MAFNEGFNFDGPTPPCGKNCPDRSAGCSVTCERWKAYIAERNENYKTRMKKKNANVMTVAGQKAAAKQVKQPDFRKKRTR